MSRLVALGAVARGVGVRWNFELPVVAVSPRDDDEVTVIEERDTDMINHIYWVYKQAVHSKRVICVESSVFGDAVHWRLSVEGSAYERSDSVRLGRAIGGAPKFSVSSARIKVHTHGFPVSNTRLFWIIIWGCLLADLVALGFYS